MAFNPPEQFSFTKPTTWPAWRQRFSRYTLASKLDREDKAVQISSLIYAMGPEAEKIYTTFTGMEDTTLQQVLVKFDEHFVPRVNVLHERALFHSRSQLPDENVETYARKLYELSEHANFPNREECIRDRLVLGVRNREPSEKLQLQTSR